MFNNNINERNRQKWLQKTLADLPQGLRILDAGAGELKNQKLCGHLHYTSQDFNQYTGRGLAEGLQTGQWDTSRIDLVSGTPAALTWSVISRQFLHQMAVSMPFSAAKFLNTSRNQPMRLMNFCGSSNLEGC